MSKGAWREGRRAWERLGDWYREGGVAVPPDDQGDPLSALGDVGTVRRLLDGVELEAVRAARRRGRSWAEIATKLGVTRQSAWERWRDLDTDAPAAPTAPAAGPVGGMSAEVAAEEAMRAAAGDMFGRVGRRGRRHTPMTVPSVVGMTLDEARAHLTERGLVGLAADPSDLPGFAVVVTGQSPEAGATARPGDTIRLWLDRGGGSGVREPRRPRPTSLTGRKAYEEPTEEAVG